MSDTNDLRALVQSRKGQWSRIARIAGLNIKTLSRIASGETPDVRTSTDRKIREALHQLAPRDSDISEPASA